MPTLDTMPSLPLPPPPPPPSTIYRSWPVPRPFGVDEQGSGPPPVQQAAPAVPQAGSNMLGLAALLVPVGAYGGYKLWGWKGGIAGSLFGGATVNVIRAILAATGEDKGLAVEAATYALIGSCVGLAVVADVQKGKEP